MDALRRHIAQLAQESGATLAQISKKIGRNQTFLQQYLNYNKPKTLSEQDRTALADFFRVDEETLRDPAHPKSATAPRGKPGIARVPQGNMVMVDEPEAMLHAGAGGVAVLDADGDRLHAQWGIPADYLRHEVRVSPNTVKLIQVKGDSMMPTLQSGDRVMIDTADRTPSPPGIFALWDGLGVVIKRLDPVPKSDPPAVRVISDNIAYSPYQVSTEEMQIIGRAIWYGRRM